MTFRTVIFSAIMTLCGVHLHAAEPLDRLMYSKIFDEWSVALWTEGKLEEAILVQQTAFSSTTERLRRMVGQKTHLDQARMFAGYYAAIGNTTQAESEIRRAKTYSSAYIEHLSSDLRPEPIRRHPSINLDPDAWTEHFAEDFTILNFSEEFTRTEEDYIVFNAQRSHPTKSDHPNIYTMPVPGTAFALTAKIDAIEANFDARFDILLESPDLTKIHLGFWRASNRLYCELQKIGPVGTRLYQKVAMDHVSPPITFGVQKIGRQISMLYSINGIDFMVAGKPVLITGDDTTTVSLTASDSNRNAEVRISQVQSQLLAERPTSSTAPRLDQSHYFIADEPEVLGEKETLQTITKYCVGEDNLGIENCTLRLTIRTVGERKFLSEVKDPGRYTVWFFDSTAQEPLANTPLLVVDDPISVFPTTLRGMQEHPIVVYGGFSAKITNPSIEAIHRLSGEHASAQSAFPGTFGTAKFALRYSGWYDLYFTGVRDGQRLKVHVGEVEIVDLPAQLHVDETTVSPTQAFNVSAICPYLDHTSIVLTKLPSEKQHQLRSFPGSKNQGVLLNTAEVRAPGEAGTYLMTLLTKDAEKNDVVLDSLILQVVPDGTIGREFEIQDDDDFNPEEFLDSLNQYLHDTTTHAPKSSSIWSFFVSEAHAENASGASPTRQEKIKTYLARLNYEKLQKLHLKLGEDATTSLSQCLCGRVPRNSSVGVSYHPAPHSASPACEVSGGPCMLQGFGCWKVPLPRDAKAWEYCLNKNEALINAIDTYTKNAPPPPTIKKKPEVPSEAECEKRQYAAYLDKQATRELDAAEWHRSQGKAVLPPPHDPEYKQQIKALQQLQQSTGSALWRQTTAAKKKLQNELTLPSLTAIQDNKAAFDTSVDLVLGLLQVKNVDLIEEQNKLREDITAARKNVKSSMTDREQLAYKKHLNDLQKRRDQIQTKKEQLKNSTETMKTLKNAFANAKSVTDAYAVYQKLQKGQNVEGMIDATKIFEKYLGEYAAYVKNNADEYEAILLKAGGTEAQAALSRSRQNSATQVAELSSGVKKALAITDKAKKAYAIYEQFNEVQREAERLRETGKFSESAQKMYHALEILGRGTKFASEYFPPGVSEAAQYYAEAILLPVKLDEKIKQHLDRMDYGADIYGSLAQSPGMRSYKGPPLSRDEYLFRRGGLGVFIDDTSRPNRYFALTSPDRDMITMSEKQFKDLQKMAYYHSLITGERMTNSMLQGVLTNDVEMAKGLTFAGLARMHSEAKAAIDNAAELNALRKQLGKDTLTPQEIHSWKEWQKLLRSYTSSCPLEVKQEKNLFQAFRDNPIKVQKVLSDRWFATTSRK